MLMRTARWIQRVGFIALLLTAALQVHADNDVKLVVFGDSLSDPGNFFALTGLSSHAPYDLIPSAPYRIGGNHFTNGKTWIEQLAESLDSQAGPAFRSPRFTNYAVGGARARADGFMDLTTQVSSYLSRGNSYPADTIYIVMIGGNDVRDAIESLLIDPTGKTSFEILLAAVTSVTDNLQSLYRAGARQIVVANTPDLSVVPAIQYAGPQVQGLAHFLSLAYNVALNDALNRLEAVTGAPITRLDIYSQLNAIVAAPASFGFSNVSTPCLSFGVIDHAVCENPDSYFFWDGIHPTRQGHAVIADYAKGVMKPLVVVHH